MKAFAQTQLLVAFIQHWLHLFLSKVKNHFGRVPCPLILLNTLRRYSQVFTCQSDG